MHNLQRKEGVLVIPDLQNPNSTLEESTFFGPGVYNWLFDCHGFLHNVTLILTSLAFVLYLAFQAKKSFTKLSHGRSYIIIAYYGSLWLVSLLNLAWCCIQVRGFLPNLDWLLLSALSFSIGSLIYCIVS